MDDIIYFSPSKRERMKKEADIKTVKEMRSALPVYNLDQIRQFKMPYHEALLLSLEEKGFHSSVAFLNQLFEYQEDIRNKAGPGTYIWMRPKLIDSKNELDTLSQRLQKSEALHVKKAYAAQCLEFLQLAIYFAFSGQDWWWLGEQLLIQSITVSMEYKSLEGKFEALSRYSYAKFQIENVREYRSAQEQLDIARELCVGRGWNTKQLFSDSKHTLFMEINYLLYICISREAKYMMNIDYDKAYSLIILAKKRAGEACCREGETEALLMKGTCEMNTGKLKLSINTFLKAFNLQKKIGSQEGMCRVRIQMAKAYLMDDNPGMSLQTLMDLKEAAEEYSLQYYLGLAYKNLGEYYLIGGEADKANTYLKEAINLFGNNEQVSVEDAGIVRNLEAISEGLDLFSAYIVLLDRTEENDGTNIYMTRLLKWKDSRKPFWNKNKEVASRLTLQEAIKESYVDIKKIKSTKSNILKLPSQPLPIEEEAPCDNDQMDIVKRLTDVEKNMAEFTIGANNTKPRALKQQILEQSRAINELFHNRNPVSDDSTTAFTRSS